jgi:WD40 repeat protein
VVQRRELRRIASKGEFHAAFAPDGRTVASGLRVWDVSSGRRIDAFPEGRPVREATSYTSDGRRLISVAEEGVSVWDFATGVEVQRPIRAKLYGWFNTAVSPDRRLVATGNISKGNGVTANTGEAVIEPAIRVWELASGKQVAKLLGHTGTSACLAFSPDSRMIASVSGGIWNRNDRGARVWDIATGRQLRRFNNYPGGAIRVAYLPDGRSIVSASEDGTALVWDVSDLADRNVPEPADTKTLEALWSDLASDDASRAYGASCSLSTEGAVPFLRARLRPAASAPARTDASGGPISNPEVLRVLRAIAALERIGTPAAREMLKKLAGGDPAAPTTQDAAAALLRLAASVRNAP